MKNDEFNDDEFEDDEDEFDDEFDLLGLDYSIFVKNTRPLILCLVSVPLLCYSSDMNSLTTAGGMGDSWGDLGRKISVGFAKQPSKLSNIVPVTQNALAQ